MSMLEVQGSPEETKAKYKKIIEYGNKLGFQTFLDVNPDVNGHHILGWCGVDRRGLSTYPGFDCCLAVRHKHSSKVRSHPTIYRNALDKKSKDPLMSGDGLKGRCCPPPC